jgi:hypothetical protein
MASNDVEVLDPAATVEKIKKIESGVALNRRHFMAALGVAGAAVGMALVSGTAAVAQQTKPNGYAQLDVMNFLMNIKYLKATLYSFITQGVDILPSTYVTLGTGQIYDQPAKITFPTQQIGDMFNEMYYDELNQLIDLRALIGANVVANRPTMDMLGTGNKATATTTMTANQAMGMARMLEDVSVQAFAGAAAYLTGTNLAYVSQILAVDGAHAGAVRLACIQNNVPYISTNVLTTTAAGAQTVNSFTGTTTTGSSTILTLAPTNAPVVGNAISGIGVPEGAVVTSYTPLANSTFTAITTSGKNTLTSVSSISGLVAGQPITGTGIPASTYILNVVAGTVTISANATATITTAETVTVGRGIVTISVNATATGVTVLNVLTGDLMDVEPYDPGTAALAAAGPSAITIPSSIYSTGGPTTPTIYQGFFNTAGAGTASANTPAGMAFARSFGQVLSVLFGTTQITPPTYQGGFFPVGVSGSINVNTDQ